jgi:parvulin-like peptidyl-prolyl isomerase
MAKHERNNKHEPPASKSRQSVWKQHKRLFSIIIIIAVVVIAGIAGWDINYSQNRPYRQTVMTFNGKTIDMRYFINTAKIYYGTAPPDTSISQFADFLEQQIERNETIIQGSSLLGIQLDRDDIANDLKIAGKKANREQVDVTMAEKLVVKQVPAVQPQYHVQTMLLENEAAAQSAMARVQAGEEFNKVAGEVSRVPAGLISSSDLGWVTLRQADIVLSSSKFGDIISGANTGVLNGPVYDDTILKQFGYWVLKSIEKKDATDNTTLSQVHVQGLLVGSEQEAEDVINKLNSGADINELAKQISQLPTANISDAEIGWLTKSPDPGELDGLFDLPVNTLYGPVGESQSQTKGGYWVFNILEKNDYLALTDNQQSLLETDFFNRCTAELTKDPDYKVENLLDQEMKDFALNKVVLAQGEGSVLIRTDSLPQAEVGANYSQKIEIYGDTRGNTWAITSGSLPEGLSLDKSTGLISGVPIYGGGSGFTVDVSNAFHFNKEELFINIRLPLSITSTSLPDGQAGTEYSTNIEVFDNGYVYTWSVISGSLPDGLALNEYTGRINGTPSTAGSYTFTVQIDDELNKATKELSILIQ